MPALIQVRNPLAPQLELPAALRSLGNLDRLDAFQRLDLKLRPQRRLRKRDRHHAVQVVAVTLEELVSLDVQDHVEIARRPAELPGLALTLVADPRVLLDAGRNLHQDRVLGLDPRLAAARRARIDDQRARSAAHRAGLRHREEALLEPLLAASAALRAGHRLLALRRAASVAVPCRSRCGES